MHNAGDEVFSGVLVLAVISFAIGCSYGAAMHNKVCDNVESSAGMPCDLPPQIVVNPHDCVESYLPDSTRVLICTWDTE